MNFREEVRLSLGIGGAAGHMLTFRRCSDDIYLLTAKGDDLIDSADFRGVHVTRCSYWGGCKVHARVRDGTCDRVQNGEV